MIVNDYTELGIAVCSSENFAVLEKYIYRSTNCGASIQKIDNGVKVGSIIEGYDAETKYYDLVFPFNMGDFYDTITAIEREAAAIWNEQQSFDEMAKWEDEQKYYPETSNIEDQFTRHLKIETYSNVTRKDSDQAKAYKRAENYGQTTLKPSKAVGSALDRGFVCGRYRDRKIYSETPVLKEKAPIPLLLLNFNFGDIMDNKYRDEKLNEHMFNIDALLTAISGKESANLGVKERLKKDKEEFFKLDTSEDPKIRPLMSFDKAVQTGMMEIANNTLIEVKALATSLDRMIVMVDQMADEMSADGNENCHKYRKRLEILTNFSRIVDEFKPEKSHQFASR